MRILAFDCALEARSAALFEDERLVAGVLEQGQRQHAERLVALLAELLAGASWSWSGLDLICLTRGPGSFTGLRIGLAAARGLALARGLPVLGIGTLEALAAGVEATPATALLALIDARRGQLYTQAFDVAGAAASPPALLTPAALTSILPPAPVGLVGSGTALALAHLTGAGIQAAAAPAWPEAARFGRLACARADQADAARPPEPLYLRAPDARPKASA
jgi:tRNA threonylcarbamoyladenosine biosynthesis protein TsaB